MERILESLRKKRESLKLTRKDVAKKLFISESLLNQIEHGRNRLSLELFIQLCNLYKVNPLDILKDENDDNKYFILTAKDVNMIKLTIEILNKIVDQNKNNQNININQNNGTININQKDGSK